MRLTRRGFVVGGGALAAWTLGCGRHGARRERVGGPEPVVNDLHAQLNETRVERIVQPESLASLQRIVKSARRERKTISIAGGRHAMGGQQFASGSILVDMNAMRRVIRLDPEAALIEVEAGIQWPELIRQSLALQGPAPRWGIIQKQTGADRLSIGGALAANVHGRGLRLQPFIADVESFVLVDASGDARRCDRRENAELFSLAIGGYGLFGPIASVTLRLAPRRKLERVVQVIDVEHLMPAFERRIAEGFLFGDFQYATATDSRDFLRRGVFSCYRPVEDTRPIPSGQKDLSEDDWRRLLVLSHADKRRAFEAYAAHYAATSGQLYWSDEHQLSVYLDHYHTWLDRDLAADQHGTEMITEIYVPRDALVRFLDDVRRDFREHDVNVIYGTVRLIERDEESFLAWARQPYACIIFNLHVVHTPAGIAAAERSFRRLIDLAIMRGGSYYLTYHRWATRRQVETCYPQFVDFLRRKRAHDPEERFQSEWYRHYVRMFADALG